MHVGRSRGTRSALAGAVGAALCLAALACGNYTRRSLDIKRALAEEDYARALEQVEGIDQSSSGLLYLYEKGLILHYQDRFAESNEAFEAGEQLLEELYTKSVTRELAATAVTDNITKYRGAPFEAVLVNYYKILNYLHLGDVEGATVECRRVNRKLQMIADAGEKTFANDPFLQYLTGMVYETAREPTEASVSYRVAASAYDELGEQYGVATPSALFCDAAANARRLGDAAEAESYAARASCGQTPRDRVRLSLFLECGYVAYKVEENVVLPIFKDDRWDDADEFAPVLVDRYGNTYSSRKVDYLLRVALPRLEPTPVPYEYALVRARPAGARRAERGEAVRAVTVENVDAVAAYTFAENFGKILLRATVRALIKYGAKKAADNKDEGLGALVNLIGVATESADTRSWSTLPQRILMARLELEPGIWDLDVEFHDESGARTGETTLSGVEIHEGRAAFINYRVY
ncbi:MAG: hypothetical protein OEO21_07545 [Candidatus Krumholzibacteria bacterium]|nr:hypothetical protein [Candidatus Krumholzibacteria bacterium]